MSRNQAPFSRVPQSQKISCPIAAPRRRSASVSHRSVVTRPSPPNFNFSDRVIHISSRLVSFEDIEIPSRTREIDLSGNMICSFIGLGDLTRLEILTLTDNCFSSFAGFPRFPRLHKMTITGNNSICGMQFYRIALLVLCPTLRIIDGERVRTEEVRVAKEYNAEHASLIRSGWKIAYPPPNARNIGALKRAIVVSMTSVHPGKEPVSPKIMTRRTMRQSEILAREIKAVTANISIIAADVDVLKRRRT